LQCHIFEVYITWAKIIDKKTENYIIIF